MIENFRHYGIAIKNRKVMEHYYLFTLGFSIYNEGKLSKEKSEILLGFSGPIHYLKLKKNQVVIEFYLNKGVWLKLNSLTHISLTVDNIEALWSKLCLLQKLGSGKVVSSAIVVDNSYKLFFARDPEGNLIEFVGEN